MGNLNILDTVESLIQRDSWKDYTDKNSAKVTDMTTAHTELNKALKTAIFDKKDTALREVYQPAYHARKELKKIATLTKEGWIKNEGVADDKFAKVSKLYNEHSAKLESFLSGKEKTLVGKTEVAVSETLRDTFLKAEHATHKVGSGMNGMFSLVQVEGTSTLNGVGKAIKHNLEGMQFWKKDIAKGRGGQIAMRYATVGLGLAASADSLRGKDKDGEPRKVLNRVLEGAVGVLATAGGLIVAHAR